MKLKLPQFIDDNLPILVGIIVCFIFHYDKPKLKIQSSITSTANAPHIPHIKRNGIIKPYIASLSLIILLCIIYYF